MVLLHARTSFSSLVVPDTVSHSGEPAFSKINDEVECIFGGGKAVMGRAFVQKTVQFSQLN